MMKDVEAFRRSGTTLFAPVAMQFSYLDACVGAMREMLSRGFTVSIKIDCAGEPPVTSYEISASKDTIAELVEGSGVLLGADYDKPEYHEIAKLGAEGDVRKKILDTLDAGFDVFLVPNTTVGAGTHYALWCPLYET